MNIRNALGTEISTLDEWREYSPLAKGDLHWKDGRSAKELAEAWLINGFPEMPSQLKDIVESNPVTSQFEALFAIPELETKLDDFKGNGRNHDLVVIGEAKGIKTLISIEAKVDESFGDIVGMYINKSVKANPRTKVPERVQQLLLALFDHQDANHLRYQLIHAVAGALIEAKRQGAAQAILIIHEFVPMAGKSEKAAQNERDLNDFMALFAGVPQKLLRGELIGPLRVKGGGKVPKDMPLYIGKIETNLL